jgi:DNA repair protein SbcC/Rad50
VEVARREAKTNAAEQQRQAGALADQQRVQSEAESSLQAVLGTPLPDDPVTEIERRVAERGRLEEAERALDRAAAEAATELLKAQQDRDRVLGAVDRQRDRLATDQTDLFDRAARAGGPTLARPMPSAPPDGADADALGRHADHLAAEFGSLCEALAGKVSSLGTLEQRLLREATEAVGAVVEPADSLDGLAQRVNEAVRAATAEAATTAKAVEDLAARVQRRKDLAEEVVGLEGRARLFKALAQELRADRLVAFLQAEALQVLAAAGSERLGSLSDGRYRLVCHDDEFLVVDTWNGDEERSVRTLSGGETFLASLALALALAEHVRSLSVTDRARLDSLFLDEGFGTLDPETLRTVVDAIEQLAGDGRLVGVITHVPELAEQFPRIEVLKDRVGSRLEVVA